MIRNVSISTFINIIFSLALVSIFITFGMFINHDKQKHEIALQNRYELIAENFLSSLKNEVDSSEQTLKALYFLHTIAITENDENLAEKYLLDMKKRTKEKDPDVFERSGKFYLYVKNDYVKAEEEFNKSVTLDPKKEIYYMALIGLYEMKQDEEKVNEFTSK